MRTVETFDDELVQVTRHLTSLLCVEPRDLQPLATTSSCSLPKYVCRVQTNDCRSQSLIYIVAYFQIENVSSLQNVTYYILFPIREYLSGAVLEAILFTFLLVTQGYVGSCRLVAIPNQFILMIRIFILPYRVQT